MPESLYFLHGVPVVAGRMDRSHVPSLGLMRGRGPAEAGCWIEDGEEEEGS